MGLQDRDYMRARNRLSENQPTFRPPAEKQSFLWMLLWWLAIAFILFKMFGWWQEQGKTSAARMARAAAPQQTSQLPPPQAPAPQRNSHVVRAEEDTTVALPPPPRPTQSVTAPENRVIETSRPQTSGTIYHCKSYSGGTFWAQSHCSQHNALIDRIASVPAGLPFETQVNIAEQQRQAAARNIALESVPMPAAAPSNKSECQSLDKQVEHLDAMARQPQSGQMQDWIRAQRQKARDRQFALRC